MKAIESLTPEEKQALLEKLGKIPEDPVDAIDLVVNWLIEYYYLTDDLKALAWNGKLTAEFLNLVDMTARARQVIEDIKKITESLGSEVKVWDEEIL